MDSKTVKNVVKGMMGAVRTAFKGAVQASNVATENQTLQIEGLEGEALPDLEYFQHFGQASRPPNGKQGIAIPLGGKTSHAVVVAVQGDKVMVGKLAPGEAIQYSIGGGFIHSKADGTHEIKGDVKIIGKLTTTESVNAGTDVVATNDVKDKGGAYSMGAMRGVHDAHDHPETNNDKTGLPNQRMNQ